MTSCKRYRFYVFVGFTSNCLLAYLVYTVCVCHFIISRNFSSRSTVNVIVSTIT